MSLTGVGHQLAKYSSFLPRTITTRYVTYGAQTVVPVSIVAPIKRFVNDNLTQCNKGPFLSPLA